MQSDRVHDLVVLTIMLLSKGFLHDPASGRAAWHRAARLRGRYLMEPSIVRWRYSPAPVRRRRQFEASAIFCQALHHHNWPDITTGEPARETLSSKWCARGEQSHQHR
jgi:hypothetical protein